MSRRRYRLVDALVATPEGGPEPGEVEIDGAVLAAPRGAPARSLRGGTILPGFVNGHDHLDLDGLPRTGRRGAYGNATEWYEDVQRERARPGPLRFWLGLPVRTRLAVGAFVNLLNGVVAVAHHNPYRWAFRRGYPVEVVRRQGLCHSLAVEPAPERAFARTPPGAPFVLHFAEGVDAAARAELDELERRGLLTERTVLVHGVGVPPGGWTRIAAAGASAVWCPSSNLFLFGRTMDAAAALGAGATVALGTDSTLSGDGGLLRELRRAHAATGLEGGALLDLVTRAPVRIFRLEGRGGLAPGDRADLVVLSGERRSADGLALSRLRPADIVLVIRAGRPVLASPALAGSFEDEAGGWVSIVAGGVERRLARRYRRWWEALGEEGRHRLDELVDPASFDG